MEIIVESDQARRQVLVAILKAKAGSAEITFLDDQKDEYSFSPKGLRNDALFSFSGSHNGNEATLTFTHKKSNKILRCFAKYHKKGKWVLRF